MSRGCRRLASAFGAVLSLHSNNKYNVAVVSNTGQLALLILSALGYTRDEFNDS